MKTSSRISLIIAVCLFAISAESGARNIVTGLVSDSVTGKGIPGVPVTDGYNYVRTDASGKYRIEADPRSRNIYYTTPSGYAVQLDDTRHLPAFFSSVTMNGRRHRVNFTLQPLPDGPENDFTLIMVGDPQCANVKQANRYINETLSDICTTASGCGSPVYAVTLGDITFDSSDMWETMSGSMSNLRAGGRYLPFFQCMGNHDHDSLQEDTEDNASDDYRAKGLFNAFFGPSDYSFDRGDVHIIVMDDIIVTEQAPSAKSNGRTWKYEGGFTDEQYEWIKQDIACVDNPSEKMLVFCVHIPFRGTGAKNLHHQGDVLKLMKLFKECHIMAGHTHTQFNYIHKKHITAGGTPIYEHIHGTACGAWWASKSNLCGTPCGYNVYDISGANVASWRFKGTNRPAGYQLRVYDASQIYGGNNSDYRWTDARVEDKTGTVTVGIPEAEGCLVAEVFDDDDINWTVELWIDGRKAGDFIRKSGSVSNVPLAAFWHNVQNRSGKYWRGGNVSHFWYCKLPDGLTMSDLEDGNHSWNVVARFSVPTNRTKVLTYSCSRISRGYEEF